MKNVVETIEYKGYKINIYQDDCDESPREWDNLGKMLCSHRRYNLGDEQLENYNHSFWNDFTRYIQNKYNIVDYDEKETYLYDNCSEELTEKGEEKINKWIKDNIIVLPLYLYDHSGITISTSEFSCRWDSGQVGYIFVDFETIKKEYGVKRVSKKLKEKVKKVLKSEVNTYDDYIRGNIYGFMIEDEFGNEEGGCWGFYGYDWKENGLLSYAKDEIKGMIEEKKDIIDNVASQVI